MRKRYSFMSKRTTIFGVVLISLVLAGFVLAQTSEPKQAGGEAPELNFFYSSTCPHCARENEFLDELEKHYPELIIKRHNIAKSETIRLLMDFYESYRVPDSQWGLVPVLFTDAAYFVGFDEQTAKDIEVCAENCIAGLAGVVGKEDSAVAIPIIGKIDPADYSLPALAVVLGFFDGFNVCSLGALVLILGLVLALGSRKKILFFGALFILTTAIIYGLLITVWYQVFSFFASYLRLMEILIGLLGIGGGAYFLKEFLDFKRHGPVCEIETGKGIMTKFSIKMKQAFEQGGSLIIVAGSILLFAAVITVVEFPCSAAVPLFFAGLLVNAQLSGVSYLAYIALFILFYMLDEIVVFLIAAFTMSIKLAGKKLVLWLTLIESIVLFALGFYYLFGFWLF